MRARASGAALAGGAVALLVGCTAGQIPTPTPSAPTTPPPEAVTIAWALPRGAQVDFWQDVADEYMADHRNVTIEVEVLEVDAPPVDLAEWDVSPDVLPADGSELVARVQAGQLRDLTDDVQEELADIGGVASSWQLAGRTYGLPYSVHSAGFWYNAELFAAAGIETVPATLDELYEAIDALKAAGIAPIAVNAGAAEPGATMYWDLFALRTCPPEVLEGARTERVLDDPCFVAAGELLGELVDVAPFHRDYLTASSSSSADSAEGLVATGQAAMMLGYSFTPTIMGGIVTDLAGELAGPPEFLGWFPFPAVSGADGEATGVLGFGSGFAVAADAPDAAVDLVRYIVSADVQARMVEGDLALPVRARVQDLVDPLLQPMLQAQHDARYAIEPLQGAYRFSGPEMSWEVMGILRGDGSAQAVVDAMNAAIAAE